MNNLKIKLVALLVLSSFLPVHGQIAKWHVKPDYDNIEVLENGYFKVLLNGRFGLLDKNGVAVLPVEYDEMTPFHEDRTLLYKNGKFSAVMDVYGNVIDLSDKNYVPLPNAKCFHSGYLLVKKGSEYFYLDVAGKEAFGPFIDAYPYSEGYACVRVKTNPVKDPSLLNYELIDLEGKPAFFNAEERAGLQFLSSLRDGRALLVSKGKFYWFDSASGQMEQISTDGTAHKKSIVVAIDGKTPNVSSTADYIQVSARNGVFIFDKLLRINRYELTGNDEVVYREKPKEGRYYTTSFDKTFYDQKYGLVFKGQRLLPPQFDEILHMEGRYAVVRTRDDKCGVITVDEDNSFVFKLNDNEPIDFRHKYYNPKLTVLMPPCIKCSTATVKSYSRDCEIMPETRKEIENIERNALEYICRLSIPKELTDTVSTHQYQFVLTYDGLRSEVSTVNVEEWYVKYYDVSLANTNTNFNITSPSDTINVEFDVVMTEAARNDGRYYPKTVEVTSPDLGYEPVCVRINENRNTFQIHGVEEGRVRFFVNITEDGCPSIIYPFEMVFTKPAPEDTDKKTTVTVKAVRKPKPKPAPKKEEKPIFVDNIYD